MTTTIKIENVMPTDYPKTAKVVLIDEAGNRRHEAFVHPNQSLHFNVWGGVKLEVTEELIRSQV